MAFRRWERPVRTFTYAVMGGAGVATLAFPPVTIASVIGSSMAVVWGVLLLIGGVTAAYCSATFRWVGEYLAMFALGAGVTIYVITLWSIIFDSSGWSRLTQTLLLMALVGFMAQRWIDLHTLTRSARTER